MVPPISTATPTVTVRIMGGKDFGKGVSNAKRFGGKFDASTKTWMVPTHQVGPLNLEPWRLGWVVVASAPTGRCPHWTVDQGCPLHGELCHEDAD